MGSLINVAIIADARMASGRLFDPANGRDNTLERYAVFKEMGRQRGIRVGTDDQFESGEIDIVLFHNLQAELKPIIRCIRKNQGARLFYIASEPPLITSVNSLSFLSYLPFHKILTWNDDVVETLKNAVKLNIGQPVINSSTIPSIDFEKKKFMGCVFSAKSSHGPGELYTERLKAFEYFSATAEGLDLFGVGWDTRSEDFLKTSYRGVVDSKIDVLQDYKFSICFENSRIFRGYITEKLFDCFAAGTVPVYYGAPNVGDYIPGNCYIDFRNYKSYDHLYDYLRSMSVDEYDSYLNSVKAFLKSDEYMFFSSAGYANRLCELCLSDVNDAGRPYSVFSFKAGVVKSLLMNGLMVLRNLQKFRRLIFELISVW